MRRDRMGGIAAVVWVLGGVGILVATVVSVSAGDEDTKNQKPGVSVVNNCVMDEVALEDIRKAREHNEAKARDLAEKEAELKVQEQTLNDQLKQLQKLREEIGEIEQTKKEQTEAKVQQLTDTILIMSPKVAAKMLSSLNEKLSVDIMTKMDSLRLAKVMNAMDIANSSRLSERLAGINSGSGKSLAVVKQNRINSKGGDSRGESSVTANANDQESDRGQKRNSQSIPNASEKVARTN